MDRRFSHQDLVSYLSRLAHDKGATAANDYIKVNFSEEQVRSSEWISGMRCAFEYSSLNENRRLLSATKMLGDAGFYLPMEALFRLGFPRQEFIVNIDLSRGRLGDTLVQLAIYVHAMHYLNLLLLVKPSLSVSKRVLLSKSNKFESDLVSVDLTPPIAEYLHSIAVKQVFERSLLESVSPLVLEGLSTPSDLCLGLDADTVVLHIRAGDALFLGALNLPPLGYYKEAIKSIRFKWRIFG